MTYNLIDEKWIPVRRRSGLLTRIAPWEITDATDPVIDVASPRPDFDGALVEFLIGLVQTVAAPSTADEWEERHEVALPVEQLRERMQSVRAAFDLTGPGRRFMQDREVAEDAQHKELPIGALLIDRMGEEGLAESANLFAKPDLYPSFGLPAAAMALMTMQTFAPSGGRGHCTSLRGGGPLSVFVHEETLWRTIWCNVLLESDLRALPGDASLTSQEARFPWMAPTRTSQKHGGRGTFPQDVHPLQHYWGLPRRYWLIFADTTRIGRCALLGDEGVPLVSAVWSRPDGTSYEGPFRHPLTPYTLGKGDLPPIPAKAARLVSPTETGPSCSRAARSILDRASSRSSTSSVEIEWRALLDCERTRMPSTT